MVKPILERLARAVERIAPPEAHQPTLTDSDAYIWQADNYQFRAVFKMNAVPYGLIQGVDEVKETLLKNTHNFAKGLPANNALLWGARGTGKSSVVKAVFNEINRESPKSLCLVEILHDDIKTLPILLQIIKSQPQRFLLFCDDLSFEYNTTDYKHLKALLDGGVEGKPENVLFYATSNRRHLMPRSMAENNEMAEIHSSETIDERISLSDRFGLWLGFHHHSQDVYISIVKKYADSLDLNIKEKELLAKANEWARTRGNCSGRTAYQFITDLAGQLGQKIGF